MSPSRPIESVVDATRCFRETSCAFDEGTERGADVHRSAAGPKQVAHARTLMPTPRPRFPMLRLPIPRWFELQSPHQDPTGGWMRARRCGDEDGKVCVPHSRLTGMPIHDVHGVGAVSKGTQFVVSVGGTFLLGGMYLVHECTVGSG